MAVWQALRNVWRLSASERRSVLLAVAAMAAMQSLVQFMTYLFKVLVEAMDNINKDHAFYVVVVVLVCFDVQQLLHRILDYQADRWVIPLQTGLRRYLSETAHRLLLSLSLQYHEMSQTGADIEKIHAGIGKTVTLIDRWIWQGASSAFLFFFSVMSLALVQWQIALVFAILFPVLIAVGMYYSEKARPDREAYHDRIEETKNQTLQDVQNVGVVQMFSQEKNRQRRLATTWDVACNHALAEINVALKSVWVRGIASTVLLTFVIGLSVSYVFSGNLTKGDFVFVLLISRGIIDHMWGFCQLIDETGRDSTGLERLSALLALQPMMKVAAQPQHILSPRGHVVCENLTVRYEGQSVPALIDFSVDIPPGTVVALVGKSGSGKSTAARAMVRWFDPTAGCVRIDGVDIRELPLSFRREFFGCVLQPLQLFDDTVAHNIAFGCPEASLDEIMRVAKIAQAHEFIMNLPDRYNTRIGEGGVRLSSGQQQRLAIARALLGDPKILVFDEATSNLDSESEALIQVALPEIVKGRTAIIIAHRLSTIQHAALILVLEEGRIVERGTHQSLMAHNGIYHRLQHLQAVGAIDKGAL